MDYQDAIDSFMRLRQWGLVIAYKSDDFPSRSNLAVAPNMQLIDSGSKCPRLTHINAGVMIFSNRILDMIPKAQTYSL